MLLPRLKMIYVEMRAVNLKSLVLISEDAKNCASVSSKRKIRVRREEVFLGRDNVLRGQRAIELKIFVGHAIVIKEPARPLVSAVRKAVSQRRILLELGERCAQTLTAVAL